MKRPCWLIVTLQPVLFLCFMTASVFASDGWISCDIVRSAVATNKFWVILNLVDDGKVVEVTKLPLIV